MNITKVLAFLALIILLSCGALDAWNVMPSMKKTCKVVEASSFAFLLYYYFCRRARTAKQKEFIVQFWKYYRLPLRGVGWIFIIVGAVMIIFALSARGIAWDRDKFSLSVMAITFGILAVMISNWKGDVK